MKEKIKTVAGKLRSGFVIAFANSNENDKARGSCTANLVMPDRREGAVAQIQGRE